ncbi:ATP-binding protein [Chryseobacterium gambrini]|uniref:ATP-binding protein n=1 Tax=Chryseobacterium gambrini TaxID=373672 RepID=A0ABN7CHY1_9FLAO|nr:ATP-binding protein [Chryseobacterium gambrini]
MAESFKPTIGKTVLETLTSGMYDDARFIFREYIQNAADQIDEAIERGILQEKSEGKISININTNSKTISVADNATGVSEKQVLRFLGEVANSQKDVINQKGFRGIGRLGGLGYCDKLIFETTYQGESIKTKMILDAKLLKRIIENRNDNSDAAAAISIITKIERTEENKEEHYFKVTLENVTNDKVLDVEKVTEYLSMVAPVPFSSSFTFTEEIKTYLKSRNVLLDEYNVEINENTLYKRYKNSFDEGNGRSSNLVGVDFIDIRSDEQELLAVCWYGYRELSNIVLSEINKERGIRIRTKNIAIGDETTCNRFFDQERTNQRFIGEIHTVSNGFIPNARRDYFTENTTCLQFEKNAKEILKAENLENRLAQTASKLHNRLKEIQRYKETYQEFTEKKGSFENAAAESYHLNRLKELEEKAKKAKIEIEKISVKTNASDNVRNLFRSIIGDNDLSIKRLTGEDLQISRYSPPTFEKLNEEERKVVLEIFEILEDELDFDISELIKKKIVEKFN